MLKSTKKRLAAVALAVVAAAPVAPAYAQWQNSGYQLLYERYYYDDPEMTIQVGYEQDQCTYYGASGGPTQGRYGPYKTENVWAVCNNGQLEAYGG